MASARCLFLTLTTLGLHSSSTTAALRCRTGRGGDGGTRLDRGEVECDPSSEGTSKGAMCRAFYLPGTGDGEYWQTCDYVYLNQQMTTELAPFTCADYMNHMSCCIGSDGYKIICYPARNVTWLPGDSDFYNCDSLCPGVTTTSTSITVTRTSTSTATATSATISETSSSTWSRTFTITSIVSTSLSTTMTLTSTSTVSSTPSSTTTSKANANVSNTSLKPDAMSSSTAAGNQLEPEDKSTSRPHDHPHEHDHDHDHPHPHSHATTTPANKAVAISAASFRCLGKHVLSVLCAFWQAW